MHPFMSAIASARNNVHKICQLQQRCDFVVCSTPPQRSGTITISTTHRCLSSSAGNGINGSSSGNDIIESTAATTQWKRSQYRKIENKFQQQTTANTTENGAANITSTQRWSTTQQIEPENIDDYEDVQPMWKEMESRVTRRRSLAYAERGGVSGRRNVRKSDEDMWLEAGVYGDDDTDKDKPNKE